MKSPRPVDIAAILEYLMLRLDRQRTEHIVFTVKRPSLEQANDNEICIWKAVPAAMTVTRIQVTLDAAGNEVAGDLKWADAFIGLANATVINAFDTTAGVLDDDSITAGSVAGGKCLYLSFDLQPHADIKQMAFDIFFIYD